LLTIKYIHIKYICVNVFFVFDKNTLSVYIHYMAERGRPRKPKTDRREKQLHILLTNAEQGTIEEAAKADELPASTWARRILLNAAKKRHERQPGG
jgi:hypothetical protein